MELAKYFAINKRDLKLLGLIFFIAVLAKGATVFRGLSVDDYPYSFGLSDESLLDLFLTQGRYIAWLVVYGIDSIGVNLNDTYFVFGIVALALQSALVVSVIRFVDLSDLPSAALVGGIIVTHPYLAEILTFKVILPVYSLALLFTIIAIESARLYSRNNFMRVLALMSTFAAIVTYQASLNYILIAAFGALLFSLFRLNRNACQSEMPPIPDRKSLFLFVCAGLTGIAFFFIVSLTKYLGFIKLTNRANLISSDSLGRRANEIFYTLENIYIKSEPVFSGNIKILFLCLIVVSILLIIGELLRSKHSSRHTILILILLCLLPIFSIGIIIPFKDWWPVPRVLAHSSILFGLLFLISDTTAFFNKHVVFKHAIQFARCFLVLAFILINNQIFADQQKMSQWDRFQANRIVERLESSPYFSNLKSVYVGGGKWSYPASMRTLQGDMNISAYAPEWSKLSVISESTGYNFSPADHSDSLKGEELCRSRKPWPHKDSVFIEGGLGIICLPK